MFDEAISMWMQFSCRCISVSNNVRRIIFTYVIRNTTLPISCETVEACLYFLLNQEWPPIESHVRDVMDNLDLITRDPEAYFGQSTRTLQIDSSRLNRQINTVLGVNCTICLQEIGIGEEKIILPCNHEFHSKGGNCLLGNSIENWLSLCKQCPNCKALVDI